MFITLYPVVVVNYNMHVFSNSHLKQVPFVFEFAFPRSILFVYPCMDWRTKVCMHTFHTMQHSIMSSVLLQLTTLFTALFSLQSFQSLLDEPSLSTDSTCSRLFAAPSYAILKELQTYVVYLYLYFCHLRSVQQPVNMTLTYYHSIKLLQ